MAQGDRGQLATNAVIILIVEQVDVSSHHIEFIYFTRAERALLLVTAWQWELDNHLFALMVGHYVLVCRPCLLKLSATAQHRLSKYIVVR